MAGLGRKVSFDNLDFKNALGNRCEWNDEQQYGQDKSEAIGLIGIAMFAVDVSDFKLGKYLSAKTCAKNEYWPHNKPELCVKMLSRKSQFCFAAIAMNPRLFVLLSISGLGKAVHRHATATGDAWPSKK